MIPSMELVIILCFVYISNCTVTNHSSDISHNSIIAASTPRDKHPLMEYCPHSGFSGKHETVLQWIFQVSFGEQTLRFLLFAMAGFTLMTSLMFLQTSWPTSRALYPLTSPQFTTLAVTTRGASLVQKESEKLCDVLH